MKTYEQLIFQLKEHGLRITAQRKALLEIFLANQDRVLSLPSLFEEVKTMGEELNLSTLYRNLEQLEEIHLVHKMILDDGKDYYTLICQQHHHHHIICTGCGKKVILDYCPYEEFLRLAKEKNFKLLGHDILLYGLCNVCQKNK